MHASIPFVYGANFVSGCGSNPSEYGQLMHAYCEDPLKNSSTEKIEGSSIENKSKGKSKASVEGRRSLPPTRLPAWWKDTFGGKHLPDFWPHDNGKVYDNLSGEACEELSDWWGQRKEKAPGGAQPRYPRDCVLQLERYFGGSHGCVRQVLLAWWRDRDGQRPSNKAKVQTWRERMELSGQCAGAAPNAALATSFAPSMSICSDLP